MEQNKQLGDLLFSYNWSEYLSAICNARRSGRIEQPVAKELIQAHELYSKKWNKMLTVVRECEPMPEDQFKRITTELKRDSTRLRNRMAAILK